MKTNKTFRIEIEIQNNVQTGLDYTARVWDIIFNDLDRTFICDDLLTNVFNAIKQTNGFSMLTVSLCSYPEYTYERREYLSEYRFVCHYGEYRFSKANKDNKNFDVWIDFDKKVLKSQIKEKLSNVVDAGNRAFINYLKDFNTQTI